MRTNDGQKEGALLSFASGKPTQAQRSVVRISVMKSPPRTSNAEVAAMCLGFAAGTAVVFVVLAMLLFPGATHIDYSDGTVLKKFRAIGFRILFFVVSLGGGAIIAMCSAWLVRPISERNIEGKSNVFSDIVVNGIAFGACSLVVWGLLSLLQMRLSWRFFPPEQVAAAKVIVPLVGVLSGWLIAGSLLVTSKIIEAGFRTSGRFLARALPLVVGLVAAFFQTVILDLVLAVTLIIGLFYPWILIRVAVGFRRRTFGS